jgi:hypothetical protein
VEGNPGTGGGLASLGYAPGWGSEFLYLNPFDSGDPLDSLTYQIELDGGFGFAAYYGKSASYWGTDPGDYPDLENGTKPDTRLGFKDSDSDGFGMQGTYQWEGGGIALGVAYERDVTNPAVEDAYAIYLNPAISQTWGDLATGGQFSIHFEGKFGWGKATYSRAVAEIPNNVDNTFDFDGYGLYLDGVYEYAEGGNITLAAWYVSGTSEEEHEKGKNHSLVELGDFAPFLVAYNGTTLGNGTHSNVFGGRLFDEYCEPDEFCAGNFGTNNQFAIAILGNHALTPQISVNWGIGYFQLAKSMGTWDLYTTANGTEVKKKLSKDLGWEIDLGFTFQILDNLSFETQFGYMFNGAAYKVYTQAADNNTEGTWNDPDDTFAWANVLAFTF